ncbi:MAG: hypothetical protein LBQ79_14660, partial [Deltaproteobacteria bacterium]|nr:hypothetical protein [Deltaproteobacteria bacterium]
MTDSSASGPDGASTTGRCSFCGRTASGGFPLYRPAGPDGAAACWFCASAAVKLAARGELPAAPGRPCSFCGEPLRDDGSPMAAGPLGHRLCPSCAAMILVAADADDPSLHAPVPPGDDGAAPAIWFGLLGGFGPLTLVSGDPAETARTAAGAPRAPTPARRASDSRPAAPGDPPADAHAARNVLMDAVCAVCGTPQGGKSRIYSISRNVARGGGPALDICDSCLRTAGDVFDRVRPVPARSLARCTVCGHPSVPGNPVLSLPGRGEANLCRECCGRFRHMFAFSDRRRPGHPSPGGLGSGRGFHLIFSDLPAPAGQADPHRGRTLPGFPPPRRFPPMGHSTPTGPPPRREREDPPDASREDSRGSTGESGKGQAIPPYEKAMLQRHSNWRITTVGRGLDFVRRLGGAGKPCSFCGRRPGEGKDVIVLGHDRTDLRICVDCVRLYADSVRNPASRPEAPEGARCSLCRLPVRPGLAVMTGIFPRRLMLCEICIEALDAMARHPPDAAQSGGPAPDGAASGPVARDAAGPGGPARADVQEGGTPSGPDPRAKSPRTRAPAQPRAGVPAAPG